MRRLLLLLLLLAAAVSPARTQLQEDDFPLGRAPGNYTTATFTKAAVLTTPRPPNDFSDEALALLWQQVGPVATGPITAVQTEVPEPVIVSPFAEPDASQYALHPLMPSYLGASGTSQAQLPAGFKWGVASSAFQIEGAVDADGRGPSIWDLLAHRVPNFVRDNSTADVVASHYYLYKQDIAQLAALGVPAFSLTISWPRIFPFGVRASPVNMAGVEHYDDVIRTARAAGLTVDLTLFHWDTPLALVNAYGSWSSPEIVEDFFSYAKFIISRYDEVVDGWFTINEPQYCNFRESLISPKGSMYHEAARLITRPYTHIEYQNYPHGEYFPAYNNITGGAAARFACGHHSLLAHAKVAKWYHGEFGGRHKITFKNSGNYGVANSSSAEDQAALRRAYDFTLGWFGGPWTDDGDYPQSLRDTLGDTGILPPLSQADKDMIKGSCDFYAIDAYSAFAVAALPADEGGLDACATNASHPSWPECTVSNRVGPSGYRLAPAADPRTEWLVSAGPHGVRRFLGVLTKELFPAVGEVQVTEFGFAEPFESAWATAHEATWDLRRADYFQGYLDGILAAVVEDGVNVTGAWAWAIYDNFEWLEGNAVRFGLQYVNYSSLERTPKASMFQILDWFRSVVVILSVRPRLLLIPRLIAMLVATHRAHKVPSRVETQTLSARANSSPRRAAPPPAWAESWSTGGV